MYISIYVSLSLSIYINICACICWPYRSLSCENEEKKGARKVMVNSICHIYMYLSIDLSIYLPIYIRLHLLAVPLLELRTKKGGGALPKPGGGNVTDRESNPRPLGCMSGDSITRLKRSAVMSGTGIHRLIYRDICVERGASYAACCSQQARESDREGGTLVNPNTKGRGGP